MQARMAEFDVRKLTPALAEDYLHYFDEVAFADNPSWNGCYCYLHHYPGSTDEWLSSTPAENREGVEGLIQDGRFNGLLAYDGGDVVGWCKADIRAELPDPDAAGPPVDRPFEEVGVVLCFNVAPDRRGEGIATALLETACDTLAERGAAIIDGFPRTDAETNAEHWHGPRALYERVGFSIVMEDDSRVLMRKAV